MLALQSPLQLSNQRFVYALAMSIACHAVLLSQLPGLRSAQRPPESLRLDVRLVQPAPEHPEPARAPAPRRAAPPAAPVVKRNTAQDRLPLPAPTETLPEPVTGTPERQLLVAPPLVDPTPASVAIVPPPPPVVRAPAPVADDALEKERTAYAALVARAVEQRRRYPRIALERGWEGVVELRVHFRKGGLVADIVILRSSGFQALDDQAIDMVRSADLPRLPPALHSLDFYVSLPFEFRLARN